MDKDALKAAANELATATDSDVFIFNSKFDPNVDKVVARQLASRARRENVIVIMVSEGGDPDSASHRTTLSGEIRKIHGGNLRLVQERRHALRPWCQ